MRTFSIRGWAARLAVIALLALGLVAGTGVGRAEAASGTSGLYRAKVTNSLWSRPKAGARRLTRIPAGTVVAALGPATECGAESCRWAKVAYDGKEGWVLTKWFEPALPLKGTASVNVGLNLRSGPSLNDAVLTVMPAGASVTLTGKQANGFVSVSYGNLNGWAYADYLTFYPDGQA